MKLKIVETAYKGMTIVLPFEAAFYTLPGREDILLSEGHRLEVVSCVQEQVVADNEIYALWFILKDDNGLHSISFDEFEKIINRIVQLNSWAEITKTIKEQCS
jgi:hypothetical protein